MSNEVGGSTEFYVVQRLWRVEGHPDEWIDYRSKITDTDRAREMLEFASSMAGFEGPWRIVHRLVTIVETVVG